MRKIEKKVVKYATIAEQIIESDVETVVVVKYGGMLAEDRRRYSDALVKTGIDGYRVARGGQSGKYLHHADIPAWVESFPDAEFYFAD